MVTLQEASSTLRFWNGQPSLDSAKKRDRSHWKKIRENDEK
jgi:hypothetical protein